MSEEIDDNEYFQQDFTTASEWEIFNARLEEIFHEWKLPYIESNGWPLTENQLAFCEWITQNEAIFFADVELNITRYCAKIPDEDTMATTSAKAASSDKRKCQAFVDIMALQNNFCVLDEKVDDAIHPLARWYGLRDFVVISPAQKTISNESQRRILVSSIHIAVAESNCEVPVFVQALEKKQHIYSGNRIVAYFCVCLKNELTLC